MKNKKQWPNFKYWCNKRSTCDRSLPETAITAARRKWVSPESPGHTFSSDGACGEWSRSLVLLPPVSQWLPSACQVPTALQQRGTNTSLLPSYWLPSPHPPTDNRTQYICSPSPDTVCRSSGCQIICLKGKPKAKTRAKTQPRRKVSSRIQCTPSPEKNLHTEALRNALTATASPLHTPPTPNLGLHRSILQQKWQVFCL